MRACCAVHSGGQRAEDSREAVREKPKEPKSEGYAGVHGEKSYHNRAAYDEGALLLGSLGSRPRHALRSWAARSRRRAPGRAVRWTRVEEGERGRGVLERERISVDCAGSDGGEVVDEEAARAVLSLGVLYYRLK